MVGWWIERVGVEDRERTLEGKWEWGGFVSISSLSLARSGY